MALNQAIIYWYYLLNEGGNRINQLGVRKLVQANFPLIKEVYIGNNNLSNRGVAYLSTSNWKSLTFLDLSKEILILDKSSISDKGIAQVTKGTWPLL